MTELQIITSNNGKLREFKEIFGDSKYVPVQNNIDYPEIQASSLEEVVDFGLDWLQTVSYTHLTLPTKQPV